MRILLTDSNRWPVVPRLAAAFEKLGCSVGVLCPEPGHPAQKTRSVDRTFRYSGYSPLASLKRAIRTFAPDIVIPACDRGVQHLHELYAAAQAAGPAGRELTDLIERSLGAPEAFPIVSSRYELLRLARAEGVLAPETIAVHDLDGLRGASAIGPAPWVLKADGTWGGRGVRVAQNSAEAERWFHTLTEQPGWGLLAKALLLNRDRDWTYWEWRRSRHRGLIAQHVIEGRPANCAVVCWQGEVLAGIAVEVVRAQAAQGPATVVHIVQGTEMLAAAEKIARRLRISGFFGLDFMIDHKTARPWLIEMNPRCTPPCTLAMGSRSNLVAALWAQIAGQPLPPTVPITEKKTIAYFPQAYPAHNHAPDAVLDASYLDLPDGEPELARALLHSWQNRSLAGQALDYLRRFRHSSGPPPFVTFEEVLAVHPAPLESTAPTPCGALTVGKPSTGGGY